MGKISESPLKAVVFAPLDEAEPVEEPQPEPVKETETVAVSQ